VTPERDSELAVHPVEACLVSRYGWVIGIVVCQASPHAVAWRWWSRRPPRASSRGVVVTGAHLPPETRAVRRRDLRVRARAINLANFLRTLSRRAAHSSAPGGRENRLPAEADGLTP
jgi:hypothetical protein